MTAGNSLRAARRIARVEAAQNNSFWLRLDSRRHNRRRRQRSPPNKYQQTPSLAVAPTSSALYQYFSSRSVDVRPSASSVTDAQSTVADRTTPSGTSRTSDWGREWRDDGSTDLRRVFIHDAQVCWNRRLLIICSNVNPTRLSSLKGEVEN